MNSNSDNKITISLKTLIAIIVIVAIIIIGAVVYVMYNKSEMDKNNQYNDITEKHNIGASVDNSNNNTNDIEGSANSNTKNPSSNITGKISSNTNPLAFNQWGVATRNSAGNYNDVSVSITNLTRGNQAAKIVEEYCNSKESIYKYEDAKEGMEWAVFDYSVDLSSVMTSNGAKIKVDSKIIGAGDSGSIKHNGMVYILSTMDMSSRDYTKELVAHGKFAVKLPIGYTDYLVVMGSRNGDALAYFTGK